MSTLSVINIRRHGDTFPTPWYFDHPLQAFLSYRAAERMGHEVSIADPVDECPLGDYVTDCIECLRWLRRDA